MSRTLQEYLPQKGEVVSSEDLLERFLAWAEERKINLYEAQENAVLELFDGKNVILNTPTGSGKSLVATALHFMSLSFGHRSAYTCPIKARNLSGRTGRGDTTFAGYITERLRTGIPEALQYCTALVSLKMETPGPFMGTREDVLEYIREFY